MTTVFLRPDADSSTGTWVNEAAAATLFSSINETVADDLNYIQSADNPVNDTCKIRFSNPGAVVALPMTIRFRYKKTGTGTLDLRVRLLEGVTAIATSSLSNIGDTFVDGSLSVSAGEFATITDFDNLFLEFLANEDVSGVTYYTTYLSMGQY